MQIYTFLRLISIHFYTFLRLIFVQTHTFLRLLAKVQRPISLKFSKQQHIRKARRPLITR